MKARNFIAARFALAALAALAFSSAASADQFVDIRKSSTFFLPKTVVDKLDSTEPNYRSTSTRGCTDKGQAWLTVRQSVQRPGARFGNLDIEATRRKGAFKELAPLYDYVYEGSSRPGDDGTRARLEVYKPFGPAEPSLRKDQDVAQKELFEKLPLLELPCPETRTSDEMILELRRTLGPLLGKPGWLQDANRMIHIEWGKEQEMARVAFLTATMTALKIRVADQYQAAYHGTEQYPSYQQTLKWESEHCRFKLQLGYYWGKWDLDASVEGHPFCKDALPAVAKAPDAPAKAVPAPAAQPASAAQATDSAPCTLSAEAFRQAYVRMRVPQVAAMQMTAYMATHAGVRMSGNNGLIWVWEDASKEQRTAFLKALLTRTMRTYDQVTARLNAQAAKTMGAAPRRVCVPDAMQATYADAADYVDFEKDTIHDALIYAIDATRDLRGAIRGSGGIDRARAAARARAATLPPYPFAVDKLFEVFNVAAVSTFTSKPSDEHYVIRPEELKDVQEIWAYFTQDGKGFYQSDERKRLTASVTSKVDALIEAAYSVDDRLALHDDMEKQVDALLEDFENTVKPK